MTNKYSRVPLFLCYIKVYFSESSFVKPIFGKGEKNLIRNFLHSVFLTLPFVTKILIMLMKSDDVHGVGVQSTTQPPEKLK